MIKYSSKKYLKEDILPDTVIFTSIQIVSRLGDIFLT